MFKDVKCASKTGVSKSLGEHTFMYKYSKEPAVAAELGAHTQPTSMISALGFVVPLLVIAGAVLWRRRRVHGGLGMADQAADVALIGEE